MTAWLKGGAAERSAALLLFSITLAEHSARVVVGSGIGQKWCDLGGEAVLAVGFLVLALRYGRVWLGAVMIFEGLLLTDYGMFWDGAGGIGRSVHLLVGVALSVAVPLTLAFGAIFDAAPAGHKGACEPAKSG